MHYFNKMLMIKFPVSKIFCAVVILMTIGCWSIAYGGTPDPINMSNIIGVTVYLRDFDSSSIAALDSNTLKKAYDVSYTVKDKSKIWRIVNTLNSMSCVNQSNEGISDLRALIEFKNNNGRVYAWRASFFNYENWRGDICELRSSDRDRLEKMLRAISN